MENPAKFMPREISWMFLDDNSSELILVMSTIKEPIRARFPHSRETEEYWNMINTAYRRDAKKYCI